MALKKHERERFQRLSELGCICCKKLGFTNAAEIHHLVEGYRLGHEYTIPLCPWHHRGVPIGIYKSANHQRLGPNLRDHKKEFVATWGSERELLKETNKWLDGVSPQGTKGLRENESSLPF